MAGGDSLVIKHIKCDIFESGADVICHQVNCRGVMGRGVAKQVREKYPWVYDEYKEWCDRLEKHGGILLGRIQTVPINENQRVTNLYAQNRFGYDGKRYTNYMALKNCLVHVYRDFLNTGYTIAFPYFMSCARGGGDWNIVYKMIEDIFKDYDGDILICEYDGK